MKFSKKQCISLSIIGLIIIGIAGLTTVRLQNSRQFIQKYNYVLVEKNLIVPKATSTLYKKYDCTPFLKIAIPNEYFIEKINGTEQSENCTIKEKTSNFFNQKSVVITDHSKIWKSKGDDIDKSLSEYHSPLLQEEITFLLGQQRKEHNYFLKNKNLHNFFDNHQLLLYFDKNLLFLFSLSGFDLDAREVYYQKANDNYIVQTSGTRTLPNQQVFEVFLKNNRVLNIRFNRFNKSEQDILLTKWISDGVESLKDI